MNLLDDIGPRDYSLVKQRPPCAKNSSRDDVGAIEVRNRVAGAAVVAVKENARHSLSASARRSFFPSPTFQ